MLPIWTVYDHPRDYPDLFVARLFLGERPTEEIITSRQLPELRGKLAAKGLVCLHRSPGDDPVIMETWL